MNLNSPIYSTLLQNKFVNLVVVFVHLRFWSLLWPKRIWLQWYSIHGEFDASLLSEKLGYFRAMQCTQPDSWPWLLVLLPRFLVLFSLPLVTLLSAWTSLYICTYLDHCPSRTPQEIVFFSCLIQTQLSCDPNLGQRSGQRGLLK